MIGLSFRLLLGCGTFLCLCGFVVGFGVWVLICFCLSASLRFSVVVELGVFWVCFYWCGFGSCVLIRRLVL